MIALQKQYGPFIVELRVEDNKVTQYEEGKKIRVWPGLYESCSVSYTHLTLPTNREV